MKVFTSIQVTLKSTRDDTAEDLIKAITLDNRRVLLTVGAAGIGHAICCSNVDTPLSQYNVLIISLPWAEKAAYSSRRHALYASKNAPCSCLSKAYPCGDTDAC